MFCPSCGQPPPRTHRLRCRYLPLARRLASLLPLIYRNSTARQPGRTFDSVADLLRARRSDPGRPSTLRYPRFRPDGTPSESAFSYSIVRGSCTILIIVTVGRMILFFSERKGRRRCMYIKFEIMLHGGVILNTLNIFLFSHLMSAND